MKRLKKIGVSIVVALMVISIVMPVIYVLLHSLKGEQLIEFIYRNKQISGVQRIFIEPFYINFNQYETILLKTPKFLLLFWNTFSIVVPIVLFQTLIGMFAAYGFSKMKFKGSEVLFFSYIIIMLMPFQVTIVPNYIVLNKLNMIDHYSALILPGIFSTFSVFFLKQFMEGIDDVFIEEAKIEGAREWQIILKLIMPMCKPIIVSVMVLLFIDYWSMTEQPITFLTSLEKYPLSVYLATISEENIGIAFACSVIYMILPILLVLRAENDLTEGFRISSLK